MRFEELKKLSCGDKVREIESGKIGYVNSVYFSQNFESCEIHAKDINGEYLSPFADDLEAVKARLFLFDSRHQTVIANMPIDDERQTSAIVKFLNDNGVTDKYHTLVIAEGFEIKYDDDGEHFVEFR